MEKRETEAGDVLTEPQRDWFESDEEYQEMLAVWEAAKPC